MEDVNTTLRNFDSLFREALNVASEAIDQSESALAAVEFVDDTIQVIQASLILQLTYFHLHENGY